LAWVWVAGCAGPDGGGLALGTDFARLAGAENGGRALTEEEKMLKAKGKRWEAVVWVNEEGSMTTFRDTREAAELAVETLMALAKSLGWKVKGTEVNEVEGARLNAEPAP
jgi:hypothetical protein